MTTIYHPTVLLIRVLYLSSYISSVHQLLDRYYVRLTLIYACPHIPAEVILSLPFFRSSAFVKSEIYFTSESSYTHLCALLICSGPGPLQLKVQSGRMRIQNRGNHLNQPARRRGKRTFIERAPCFRMWRTRNNMLQYCPFLDYVGRITRGPWN